MSDVQRVSMDDHAAIKAELRRYSEIYSVQAWIRGPNYWESLNDPAWYIDDTYRLIDRGGRERFRSVGTECDNPADDITPASTDYALTATDYADGCCKAALSLLMKPSREPEDIRKALAWLTLAVGGQR